MNLKALHSFGTASLLCLALASAGCRTTRPVAAHGKWKPIFNGRSIEGWQMAGPGEFKLEEGELVTHGGMGLLWFAREKFGDCQIRVIYKPTGANDNSGVFIRIPEPPRDAWDGVNRGYEVQIENRGDEWHRTGCLYSMSQAKKIVNSRVNEWNTMLITLEGKRTRVQVNGALVTDFNEGDPVPPKKESYEPDRGLRPNSGYIGLQNHGDDAHVHFREVSIAPLP